MATVPRSAHEFVDMYRAQEGLCAVCGKPETALGSRGVGIKGAGDVLNLVSDKVDGVLVGLTCASCHWYLRSLKFDADRVGRMARYLSRTRPDATEESE